MQAARKLGFRIFCFILALHFLNCSIDSRDRYPDFIPENLAINDIETIAELVSEVFLGQENTFKEHDEADHDHSRLVHVQKLFLVDVQLSYSAPVKHASGLEYLVQNSPAYTNLEKAISTPPPKV